MAGLHANLETFDNAEIRDSQVKWIHHDAGINIYQHSSAFQECLEAHI